ncbi:MAG: leucine-rich repeat protein [Rikenellaceae bacterium]
MGSDDQTATITLSGTIASNPQISASSEGLWFGVSFTATGSWEITSVDDESSQRAEWISFSCDNGDQGDATTTIYIEQNDSGAARSAIVKFYCSGDLVKSIYVEQSTTDTGLSGAVYTLETLPADGSYIAHDTWTIIDEGELTDIYDLDKAIYTTESTRHITIIMPYITAVRCPNADFDLSASTTFSLSLPEVTEADDNSFQFWAGLTEISMPKLTTVSKQLFVGATELKEVSLPSATVIDEYAFQTCEALESISLDNVTTINQYAFAACEALTSIDFPNATYIGVDAFGGCALQSVNLPKAKEIGGGAFRANSDLKTISLPEATILSYSVFANCWALETVSLPKVEEIGFWLFYDCYGLKSLTIATESTLTSVGTPLFTSEDYDTSSIDLTIGNNSSTLMQVDGNCWTVANSTTMEFRSITTI